MWNFLRRIISGNKARFKDEELDVDLDLVYITDKIIIMGYPAEGLEGLYRNHREDAIRFLRHRHGQDYWVFNLCPVSENSYDPAIFDHRVSRYPFPDHHAPPFAILPLLTREIDAWLDGPEQRVAVLHCKAGKGRSGTMACAYLLARDRTPSPPKLQRNYSAKEVAKQEVQRAINTLPLEEHKSTVETPVDSSVPGGSHSVSSVTNKPSDIENPNPSLIPPLKSATGDVSFIDALTGVLDLHTSRRMKYKADKSTANEKPWKTSQGVSIPSQRRFLYYWALVLAQQAPPQFWPVERITSLSDGDSQFRKLSGSKSNVRLTQIKLRMRDDLTIRMGLVKAVNTVIDKTRSVDKREKAWDSSKQIWASLARYDDDLVDLLEEWEVHTRATPGNMGRRRPESALMNQDGLSKKLNEIFQDGKWDNQKMIRGFAELGITDDEGVVENGQRVYILKPLGDQGVILQAGREVRLKFSVGQIFMGWAWFIPAFHITPTVPVSSTSGSPSSSFKSSLLLKHADIDFAIGVGEAITDAEIEMECVPVE